jgi:hypothetical protein
MARQDARVIVAPTPWGTSGTFWEWMQAGLSGEDPDTRAFRWLIADCPWIFPSVIEGLRRKLSPLRFRAEVLGEFVGSGDSFFSPEDIDAAMAAFPMVRDGRGCPATLGADWGGGERGRDLQAVAIAGVLDDGGINRQPIVVVPYCETSRRGFPSRKTKYATWLPGGTSPCSARTRASASPRRGHWSERCPARRSSPSRRTSGSRKRPTPGC